MSRNYATFWLDNVQPICRICREPKPIAKGRVVCGQCFERLCIRDRKALVAFAKAQQAKNP